MSTSERLEQRLNRHLTDAEMREASRELVENFEKITIRRLPAADSAGPQSLTYELRGPRTSLAFTPDPPVEGPGAACAAESIVDPRLRRSILNALVSDVSLVLDRPTLEPVGEQTAARPVRLGRRP